MYTQDAFFEDCKMIKEELGKIYGEEKKKLSIDYIDKIKKDMLSKLKTMREKMKNSTTSDYNERSASFFAIMFESIGAFIEAKTGELEALEKNQKGEVETLNTYNICKSLADMFLEATYNAADTVVSTLIPKKEEAVPTRRRWNIFKNKKEK